MAGAGEKGQFEFMARMSVARAAPRQVAVTAPAKTSVLTSDPLSESRKILSSKTVLPFIQDLWCRIAACGVQQRIPPCVGINKRGRGRPLFP